MHVTGKLQAQIGKNLKLVESTMISIIHCNNGQQKHLTPALNRSASHLSKMTGLEGSL